MCYLIKRECSCGSVEEKKVSEDQFNTELNLDADGCISMEGDNDIITYTVHSCKKCREDEIKEEQDFHELKNVPHVCGYCGSTKPLISAEEMYGPGNYGWPCCPDCGGV